jgi:hypothetical protein
MVSVTEKLEDGTTLSNGTTVPSVTSKTPQPGMECGIKDLYQAPEDKRGRFTWTDKYPEDLEKAAEDEITARYAILVRHKKCFDDSRKNLEIHSIVIQSPLLKEVLGVVLANYPGKSFHKPARLLSTSAFRILCGFLKHFHKL